MEFESTRDTLGAIRSVLLQLARHQDDLAANEAAATPYWATCPPTVLGHRAAACALREQADSLLSAS
jgi:hypothetical protein